MIRLRLGSGEKTVTAAGTAELLATEPNEVISVTIKALTSNGGKIYVGENGVSSTDGLDLDAGNSVEFRVSDPEKEYIELSDIFVDSAVNGEGVRYIYLRH